MVVARRVDALLRAALLQLLQEWLHHIVAKPAVLELLILERRLRADLVLERPRRSSTCQFSALGQLPRCRVVRGDAAGGAAAFFAVGATAAGAGGRRSIGSSLRRFVCAAEASLDIEVSPGQRRILAGALSGGPAAASVGSPGTPRMLRVERRELEKPTLTKPTLVDFLK